MLLFRKSVRCEDKIDYLWHSPHRVLRVGNPFKPSTSLRPCASSSLSSTQQSLCLHTRRCPDAARSASCLFRGTQPDEQAHSTRRISFSRLYGTSVNSKITSSFIFFLPPRPGPFCPHVPVLLKNE